MAGTAKYSDQEIRQTLAAHKGSVKAASKALGCSQSTIRLRIEADGYGNQARLSAAELPPVQLPEFPDDDIPTKEIIEQMVKRFGKRQSYQKAKDWFPVKVNLKGPIGITFWGDPHVDDDGCNWPLLNHHCDIHRANSALFSVNIGDTINNWSDRLAKLYANQETSLKTAKKLAKWFLKDSGVRWICWLAGNHDLWTDFTDYLRAQNIARVPMEDWQARFRVVFPNGRECKIWAAHDFAGSSMWNSLQGLQKAAHTKAEADIYAAGHTHNWAIHQEESGSRDFTYWLLRSRGYKYIDDYGLKLGHFPQDEGASITCVIDPDAKSQSGFIQAFADMDAASDYLSYLRRKK
jgi:hypothetical protein